MISMVVMISYDISSNRTRGKVHRFLKEFGLNTQKSIFECDLEPDAMKRIVRYLELVINPATDSVRIYRICAGCLRKVQISGLGIRLRQLDYLIV